MLTFSNHSAFWIYPKPDDIHFYASALGLYQIGRSCVPTLNLTAALKLTMTLLFTATSALFLKPALFLTATLPHSLHLPYSLQLPCHIPYTCPIPYSHPATSLTGPKYIWKWTNHRKNIWCGLRNGVYPQKIVKTLPISSISVHIALAVIIPKICKTSYHL